MRSPDGLERVASDLLCSQGLQLLQLIPIQTLWAGYGHVCRVEAQPRTVVGGSKPPTQSFILKHVTPPRTTVRQKSEGPEEGHIRKVLSYQVEQYFYAHFATLLPGEVAVAQCLTTNTPSLPGNGEQPHNPISLLLVDLHSTFPVPGEQRPRLNAAQVHAAMEWLAGFHGFWWADERIANVKQAGLVQPPLQHWKEHGDTTLARGGVWLNGGYSYLATRRKEYADLQADADLEWSDALCTPVPETKMSIAEMAAEFLSSSSEAQLYQTLVHGDVKSENLFTTRDGSAVAFFDFQYVGLGQGACDLAKLFTCSVPLGMLVRGDFGHEQNMQEGEEVLLRMYLRVLEKFGKRYPWEAFVRHWETALVDWLRFQASWGFWGNTEWLEARVRRILREDGWRKWLIEAILEH